MGVASRLNSFLEQIPSGPASPSVGNKTFSPVTPSEKGICLDEGTHPVEADQPSPALQEKTAAVVMGPFVDPLTTTRPFMVGSEGRDPAAQKFDITERLRKRRERNLGKSEDRDPFGCERQRSFGMDSDDEDSMARLASALGVLEKTAASQRQEVIGEPVAKEGHHSLDLRLESSPQEASVGGESRSSATVVAVSASSADVPLAAEGQRDTFRLQVQLADDRVSHLEFASTDDLLQCIKDFRLENGVRDMFEDALFDHVKMMVRTNKLQDSVDIVDLLE